MNRPVFTGTARQKATSTHNVILHQIEFHNHGFRPGCNRGISCQKLTKRQRPRVIASFSRPPWPHLVAALLQKLPVIKQTAQQQMIKYRFGRKHLKPAQQKVGNKSAASLHTAASFKRHSLLRSLRSGHSMGQNCTRQHESGMNTRSAGPAEINTIAFLSKQTTTQLLRHVSEREMLQVHKTTEYARFDMRDSDRNQQAHLRVKGECGR